MGRFGMGELLVILAIVVLLFGAKRLPELASGMGKAIKNFKRGVEGEDDIDVTPKTEEENSSSEPEKVKQVAENSSAVDIEQEVIEAEVIKNKK